MRAILMILHYISFTHMLFTNRVQREYQKKAKADYGINLYIVDANQIAEEADERIELQKVIYDSSGLSDFNSKNSIFDEKEKNLLYDLVSFGKSADIKLQIVEAYILQLIYCSNDIPQEKLIENCKQHFKTQENKQFYDKLLNRLRAEKKIIIANSQVKLTDKEKDSIKERYELINVDESIFIAGIDEILKRYEQSDKLEEYIFALKSIYSKNYNNSLSEGIADKDLHYLSRDFTNFIERNLDLSRFSGKSLSIDLFNFCDENKFLQKLCASKVFSEKTNLNRLENYIQTQKRLFIDTTIALYLLCFYFKPKSTYTNYYYKIATDLFNMCRNNNIKLYITDNYLKEVQTHVREAINLCPFTNLPNFDKLGEPRNIFYKFYINLKRESLVDGSFETFLYSCNFQETYQTLNINNVQTEKHLKDLGIIIQRIENEYDLEYSKKIIEEQQLEDGRKKTNFGLNNDAIMLEYLSDNDVDIHPLKPIFITWDRTFFAIYKKYFAQKPEAQRWLLFTPSQIIDYYALVNFSIDSETVSRELLAILSDEIIQNTHTLLDSLMIILNPNDEIGLEYTNRLAKMRDEQIYYPKPVTRMNDELEGKLVIDDVFYKLTKYYIQTSNLEMFKRIFTKKECIDDVMKIIEYAIQSSREMNKFDENIFESFNKIISNIS